MNKYFLYGFGGNQGVYDRVDGYNFVECQGAELVRISFSASKEQFEGVDILLASYGNEDYEGW